MKGLLLFLALSLCGCAASSLYGLTFDDATQKNVIYEINTQTGKLTQRAVFDSAEQGVVIAGDTNPCSDPSSGMIYAPGFRVTKAGVTYWWLTFNTLTNETVVFQTDAPASSCAPSADGKRLWGSSPISRTVIRYGYWELSTTKFTAVGSVTGKDSEFVQTASPSGGVYLSLYDVAQRQPYLTHADVVKNTTFTVKSSLLASLEYTSSALYALALNPKEQYYLAKVSATTGAVTAIGTHTFQFPTYSDLIGVSATNCQEYYALFVSKSGWHVVVFDLKDGSFKMTPGVPKLPVSMLASI